MPKICHSIFLTQDLPLRIILSFYLPKNKIANLIFSIKFGILTHMVSPCHNLTS
ncbi:MAG TPA: hypothetical protein PK351_04610 [Spirochaetota bacterium]|mgnify:CR=1 FL=1|nr:hypothetical protein [Spirochaetota bacterium]HPP04087.1 hypothetical protein [Spirochaetota bacterium]